jgi:tetratricopeptide (TPR) repeat protein
VTSYSRQDVLRILQISSRQLQGWERAGIISPLQSYTFQDLGQLRILRALREEAVSVASIRHSIVAMKAVAGMANPLLEASVVRTGTRLAFRHDGAMVDPIRRQLLFDFERLEQGRGPSVSSEPLLLKPFAENRQQGVQELFLTAVKAEEAGEKARAIKLYQEMMELDPTFAPAWINLGTIHFHLREFDFAERLYRRATEIDPSYVLAFFDLGNVLDELQRFCESITAYQRRLRWLPAMLTPTTIWRWPMSDGERRALRCATGRLMRGWTKAVRGPTTRRGQIRKLLDREKLGIAWRAQSFIPPRKGTAALELVSDESQAS